MEQVEFDKNFEAEAAVIMAKSMQKKKTGLFACKLVCCSVGAAACIALAIFAVPYFLKPTVTKMAGDSSVTAAAASDTLLSETSFAAQTSVPENRLFVDPRLYDQGGTGSTGVPVQGGLVMSAELRAAVDDPANEGLWFNVIIGVLPPEQYENNCDDYVYNGRTMAEWEELYVLTPGIYSYSRYNEEYGGNITEEEWHTRQEEAVSLDAQENFAAGKTEWGDKFGTLVMKAQENYRISECERLKAKGYDTFICGSQILGEGENAVTLSTLAGYLTIDQIKNFSINPECGYGLEFDESSDAAPVLYAAPSTSDITPAGQDQLPSVSLSGEVVSPDLYYSIDKNVSYPNAEPGQAVLTFGLEDAVVDPVNENSLYNALYFVFIGISTPEERANSEGYYGYIYNGKTIAQWEELLSLAQGNYSYTRYNEDHGGNITEEQWNQKKEEALTMNAAENSGAAFKEFSLKYNPITEQSIEDAEDSECERLQNLGYDVYIYEYQTNYDGEMRTYDVLEGTLTKDQILKFDTDAALGYSISWGIINGETIDKGQDSFTSN